MTASLPSTRSVARARSATSSMGSSIWSGPPSSPERPSTSTAAKQLGTETSTYNKGESEHASHHCWNRERRSDRDPLRGSRERRPSHFDPRLPAQRELVGASG